MNIKLLHQCYNCSAPSLTDVPRHVPAGGAQQEVAQLAQEVGGGQEAEHGGPGGSHHLLYSAVQCSLLGP